MQYTHVYLSVSMPMIKKIARLKIARIFVSVNFFSSRVVKAMVF